MHYPVLKFDGKIKKNKRNVFCNNIYAGFDK